MNPEPLFSELTLCTGSLLLRHPRETDVPFLFSLYSDPRVTRFLDIHPHREENDTRAFLKTTGLRRAAREAVFLLVEWEGEPAGIIRVTGVNEKHRFASAGYELAPEFWNQGIMTRAMKELKSFLFRETNLYRLEAQTHTGNDRSVRLLERCGFRKEGRMRGNFNVEGRMEDSYLYAVLATDNPY